MIFKDALRSLKNNFGKALFYWLTFVLTSMFIFLFFNISMSETVGVNFFEDKNDLALTVTIFVIAICLIIIFFANDFFVKNKSRDLAIRLICGATYMQLASYLLSQTFLLLFLAIPAGVLIALILIPFLNAVISAMMQTEFIITLHFDAIITTTIVLVSVVFWTTYLNLAFAYRNTAVNLLNERKMTNPLAGIDLGWEKRQTSVKVKNIFGLILYLMPLILFHLNTDAALLFAILGMVGFNLILNSLFIPLLDKVIHEKKMSDPKAVARIGFIRTDLQILKNNVILFLVSAILLISMFISGAEKPTEVMLSLLSYVVMNILLSLAIMFRYQTELTMRRKYFMTLEQLGYLEPDLKEVIMREVTFVYAFIILSSFPYLISMFLALIFKGLMTWHLALLLLLFMIIPLAVCYGITLYYYFTIVFPKQKEIRKAAN
ncbi:MAG: hypothetical protein K6A40_11805 [Solobacterium sp.]|nr:hypothetical protein [Solobacterium sp.]